MSEEIFSGDYNLDTLLLREGLRVSESFDIIERHLTVCEADMCFFYIDGFVKDAELLRIMQHNVYVCSITILILFIIV